jgi:phospholipase C
LKGSLAAAAATAVGSAIGSGTAGAVSRLPVVGGVIGGGPIRWPDARPYPNIPAGTDTMPQIEHILVLQMENHSYDNYLGMLQRPGADGFTLDAEGLPTNTNPYPGGTKLQKAFRMPSTCQRSAGVTQEWQQSHIQANIVDGIAQNNGFVVSESGPVSMGYWTAEDLPFYYWLASTFPLGDRFFCSLLGQTNPNRRYLIAATSAGMVDDPIEEVAVPAPNGTIFDRLDLYGVEWRDYYSNQPSTPYLFLMDGVANAEKIVPISQFFIDAATGHLPSFAIVEPEYSTSSEEDPQNIVVGQQFAASVVSAVMESPNWPTTLLIWNYDEHGGYYDHVPPPAAVPPDDIPPTVLPSELSKLGLPKDSETQGLFDESYSGFTRYGFRVPAVVVSPFAKPDHVSHVIYDQTSILAMVERKWNLPAMTYRDSNAADLSDFIDLSAHGGKGAFIDPPLDAMPSGQPRPSQLLCEVGPPDAIPAPGSVIPA